MRRRLVSGVASAWAATLLAATGGAADAPTRPNLLLVSVDTLRADRLACYAAEAPAAGSRLCALFRGGLRYRWAFSTASHTAPAIASLLSSRYPIGHGVSQSAKSRLGDPVSTVAEALRAAGYTTAAFVSNPVLDERRNLDQGFDVYDHELDRRERNRPWYAERDARSTADAALAWLGAGPAEPWFLWLHFQDPHGPYEPPDAEPARDAAGDEPLPLLSDQSGQGGIPAYQALPGVFTPQAYERRYRAEIAHLESHLVRLVAGLDAATRPVDLLLTADHGEAFGEDGYYFAHGHSLGLDQIRVPLLYRRGAPADGAEPARTLEAPVSLIDVAPTLLALAGVPAPPDFEGRVLPGIAGASAQAPAPGERALFAEHEQRVGVIHGERYYARDRDPAGSGESGLPARTATLSGGGGAPAYGSPTRPAIEPLETALADFLARGPATRDETPGPIPEEVRERMRALGYLAD